MTNQTPVTRLTITPSLKGRSGGSSGTAPTDAQWEVALKGLEELNAKGANVTILVEYLLELGWNASSISQMVRYKEPSRNGERPAGAPLLQPHINHIKTRWLAKKAEKAAAAKMPEPVKEPEGPKAPAVSEVRKPA
jgi:hypothetical protein